MAVIEKFFEQIISEHHSPCLKEISGTCRWDIQGAGNWLLEIEHGNLALVRGGSQRKADTTIICSSEDFDLMIQHKLHPMVAFLQGRLTVSGDLSLAQICMRVFRFPPDSQKAGAHDKEKRS